MINLATQLDLSQGQLNYLYTYRGSDATFGLGDLLQGIFAGGSGSGTVSSVALTAPSIFTVSGSPVTTSGTLALALATQLANRVWASPNGVTGAPTFRALVSADIPSLALIYLPLAGGTMSGSLNMGGQDLDGVQNLNGFDGQNMVINPTGRLSLNSGVEIDLNSPVALGATFNANSRSIINLPDPVNPQDAANKEYVDNQIQVFTSSASAGGSASAALTVTGLLSTDTILAVTQMTAGGNNTAVTGFNTQANNSLTITWTADPGAGAIVIVTVKR